MPDWITTYTWLWLIWIVWFVVLEAHAILFGEGGTLSAQIWALIGIGHDEHGKIVFSGRRIIVLIGMLILTIHFVFGIP